MKEVFEKIVEILENKAHEAEKDMQLSDSYADAQAFGGKQEGYENAIEIVKWEIEKFGTDTNVGSNGWISCNERLPEGRQDVLVCFDNIDGCIIDWYAPNGRTWRNSSTDNICKAEPIAWMNLPAPYQPKGE